MEARKGLLLLVKSFLKWEELRGDSHGFTRKMFCDDIEKNLEQSGYADRLSSKTLATYFSSFDNGDFKRLESSTSVSDALARFAMGISFIEFNKLNIAVSIEEISRVFAIMRINYPQEMQSGEIILFDILQKVEFEYTDIQINCITPSLRWTAHYLGQDLSKFKNNQFRYILTDDLDDMHYHRIRKIIVEHGLPIEIKKLSDYHITEKGSDGGRSYKRNRFQKIEGITFPIPADIVLYRRKTSNEYMFGIIDTVLSEEITIKKPSLKIEDERGKDLLRWFDAVWEMKEAEN